MASRFSSTAESIFLTSLQSTRTRPPPPIQPASLPIQPGALGPVAGADEDRDDFWCLARAAFDREVVDLAAASAVLVEQLAVEHVQADVDLAAAQSWPTFVSTINGTAVSATTMITTR